MMNFFKMVAKKKGANLGKEVDKKKNRHRRRCKGFRV
jgi:hypothetical protein